MCPDIDLLSAYYDDELQEPYKGELHKHICSCDKCRKVLEEFAVISDSIEETAEPDIELSAEKVWNDINAILEKDKEKTSVSFWKKKIWLSVPAAAGVAAIFALVFSLGIAGYFLGKNSVSSSADMTMASSQNEYSMQVDNIIDDDLDFVIPASKGFVYTGEPLLIREVDYKANRYR